MHRAVCLLTVMIAACAGTARADWHVDIQSKMGTRVEVQLWEPDAARAERLLADAMAEFDRIEASMSTYRDDSEITRVNRQAAIAPVPVSPELFGLVGRALELSTMTDGAFDITFDSVGRLYDFRASRRPRPDEIRAQLAVLDYRLVQLDAGTSTVRFRESGVRINLGGIAKGYAVESVVGLLRAAGVQHAMAAAGGDTRLLGDRRGKPWVVGIRDPDSAAGLVTRLALRDEAISTSGDYERFFIEDGVRYHHILDPATGESASGVRSATVIGPDATLTDGLSTSVFVLGSDAGLALIESVPGYEAVVVDAARGVRFSSGLDPR